LDYQNTRDLTHSVLNREHARKKADSVQKNLSNMPHPSTVQGIISTESGEFTIILIQADSNNDSQGLLEPSVSLITKSQCTVYDVRLYLESHPEGAIPVARQRITKWGEPGGHEGRELYDWEILMNLGLSRVRERILENSLLCTFEE
jgi:hypothetical protein